MHPVAPEPKVPYAYDVTLYRQVETCSPGSRTAAHRNPLLSMRSHILLGHLHRCRRHLLDLINES